MAFSLSASSSADSSRAFALFLSKFCQHSIGNSHRLKPYNLVSSSIHVLLTALATQKVSPVETILNCPSWTTCDAPYALCRRVRNQYSNQLSDSPTLQRRGHDVQHSKICFQAFQESLNTKLRCLARDQRGNIVGCKAYNDSQKFSTLSIITLFLRHEERLGQRRLKALRGKVHTSCNTRPLPGDL